jgi:hypothetical protein
VQQRDLLGRDQSSSGFNSAIKHWALIKIVEPNQQATGGKKKTGRFSPKGFGHRSTSMTPSSSGFNNSAIHPSFAPFAIDQ